MTDVSQDTGAALARESSNPLDWADDYNATRQEASRWLKARGLKVEAQTLARWFSERSDGPPVRHFGRRPLYPVGLLRAWADAKLSPVRTSTSQAH